MPLTLHSRQIGDVTVVTCSGRIIEGAESATLRQHLAEISREQAETKGATGRATVERSGNGTYRVVAIADKGKGRFDAGQDRAFTPIGRMVLPAGSFERFEAVKRALPNGAELDDVPVLQQLAGEGALAGALTEARFFDVGVPEGYREAVTAFPATAP